MTRPERLKDLTGKENLGLELLERIVGVNAPKSFLRPQKFLYLYKILQRDIWNCLDAFYSSPENKWPNYCFVPLILAIRYAGAIFKVDVSKEENSQFIIDHKILFTIGTWNKTQGIYKFDETLFEEITKSEFDGELSADILTKIPEYCCYIEFPENFKIATIRTYGFFALISFNQYPLVHSKPVLELVIDAENGFHHRCLTLENDFVTLIRDLLAYRKEFEGKLDLGFEAVESYTEDAIKEQLSICLNSLFYLCCKNAEVTHNKKVEKIPSNPKPINKKINAADHPNVWNVGYRIGADIRKARIEHEKQDNEAIVRNSPRPHMRTSHYHGYWIGKLDDLENRKFILKWLAPIPVNVTPNNPIVTTIRNVK